MPTARRQSRGAQLEDQLVAAMQQLGAVPVEGARDLPVLSGLTKNGFFEVPQENVVLQALGHLEASSRVYRFGEEIVQLFGNPCHQPEAGFVPLACGAAVEAGAGHHLSNLLTCEHGQSVFPPPDWLARLILSSDHARRRLPEIHHYSLRPVFSADFVLCQSGWHPESGILVQGPEIEPVVAPPATASAAGPDRLPQHLRHLLGGFCFREEADLVGAVGALLTGVLGNHFVTTPKPLVTIDGNQPGIGKTWLAELFGIVLDGSSPSILHYSTDDEELQKRICATLRGGTRSMLLMDNAKVRSGMDVSSAVIEANCLAPEVSLRILGSSQNMVRPNNFLWVLTMNHTRLSPDLTSRAMPIRLHYEGDPRHREHSGADPRAYAKEHREDILGELLGMVQRWNQQGRPCGSQQHRCDQWARIIGGILNVAGLSDFLGNVEEAAASFNTELEELAALAESVIRMNGPWVVP